MALSIPAMLAFLEHDSRFRDEDVAVVQDLVEKQLHAVLFIDSNMDNTVSAYHHSFLDFLEMKLNSIDSDRNGQVNLSLAHQVMAAGCLHIMHKELDFNICKLDVPVLNRDIPDLEERVATRISLQLQYACLFWVHHLTCMTASEHPRMIEVTTVVTGTVPRTKKTCLGSCKEEVQDGVIRLCSSPYLGAQLRPVIGPGSRIQ